MRSRVRWNACAPTHGQNIVASTSNSATLTRLVYIGGYGRSGSTLLEYLLARVPMFLRGEIASSPGRGPDAVISQTGGGGAE